MTLPEYYSPEVAKMHAELTRQLHRTAWADLWAQGIHFVSQELAFHWRAKRNEIRTFWLPMGDASMVEQLHFEMDDLVRQDEALEAAYRQAQYPAQPASWEAA